MRFFLEIGLLFFVAYPAIAHEEVPLGGTLNTPVSQNEGIGFQQRPGATLDGSLTFREEEGNVVRLSQYWNKGPVILSLVYFGCPNLCGLALNGLFKSLGDLKDRLGGGVQVLVVSINPNEGPTLAGEKRRHFLRAYGHSADSNGIHFLTGDAESIFGVTKAVGFRYFFDEKQQQYAHPSGIVILTPTGKISRYLFGIEYPERSLRLALNEADRSQVSSPVEDFLLYCYHYDPKLGTYTLAIYRILGGAALLTLLAIILGIGFLLHAERTRRTEAM